MQSAIKLGMAKGMAILAAAQKKIPVYEYAPTRAKCAVVGQGHASKWQVQKMIQTILRLPTLPEPEDAADALALAICHAQTGDIRMYESIRGIAQRKNAQPDVVECGGISYRLAIPLSTYTRLPAIESPVTLFLSLIVREDAHILYGFLQKEERDLFELLLTISGIGPKTAAAIIGHMDVSSFQRAIASADIRLLSKMPGIGKKTAERLVIEMRDKFKVKGKSAKCPLAASVGGIIGDAMNALINLGYNALDAHQAVQAAIKTNPDETDLGRLITAALQQ